MPSTTGPNAGYKYGWAVLENGWGPDMEDNLRRADVLDQLAAKDKDLATPPGSPANGDRYIVASSPTGAWAGQAKSIACWFTDLSAWRFYAPKAGWQAWVQDEAIFYVYNGSAWVPA